MSEELCRRRRTGKPAGGSIVSACYGLVCLITGPTTNDYGGLARHNHPLQSRHNLPYSRWSSPAPALAVNQLGERQQIHHAEWLRPAASATNRSRSPMSVQPLGSDFWVPLSSKKKTRSSPHVCRTATNTNFRPSHGWNGCVTRTVRCSRAATGAVESDRERHGGVVRRQLQDRADRRPRLAQPLAARARDGRVGRLVQPGAAARSARRPAPGRVRTRQPPAPRPVRPPGSLRSAPATRSTTRLHLHARLETNPVSLKPSTSSRARIVTCRSEPDRVPRRPGFVGLVGVHGSVVGSAPPPSAASP
jgi:hypothetical protein